MAHFCREYFSTILEIEGLLPRLLLEHFEPTKFLYKDLIDQGKEMEFKNYIYSLVENQVKQEVSPIDKTPEELLGLAGYDLYECKTEEDVQSFKKYYANGEALCTFRGGRLNKWYVFFAVKKDVDTIKREDFSCPKRQDSYGTSVISIQFSKDDSHTLSIKNRYNHHVDYPDATFENNLDNIIFGLTDSFAKYYGLEQKYKNRFNLYGYVLANDGKYYKYNYEDNNIYYCPNNIIIDNAEVKKYSKSRYILFEYYIIDTQEKKIETYGKKIESPFVSMYQNIKKITVECENDCKNIKLFLEKGTVILTINATNNLLRIDDPVSEHIENGFCKNCYLLEKVNIKCATTIGDNFCEECASLTRVYLPQAISIGDNFCKECENLTQVNAENATTIGYNFCYDCENLTEVNVENTISIGANFCNECKKLTQVNVENATTIGNNFCYGCGNFLEVEMKRNLINKKYLVSRRFLLDENLEK